jgi:hypothetical protein
MSTGVRLSVGFHPIVPRIPEIDLINASVIFCLIFFGVAKLNFLREVIFSALREINYYSWS